MCTLCSPIFIFDSLNSPSLAVQDSESNPFGLVLVRIILVVNELLSLLNIETLKGLDYYIYPGVHNNQSSLKS